MSKWVFICLVILGLLIAFVVDNPAEDKWEKEATPTPLVLAVVPFEAAHFLIGLKLFNFTSR